MRNYVSNLSSGGGYEFDLAANGLTVGVPLEQLRRYSIVRARDFSPWLISPQANSSCRDQSRSGDVYVVPLNPFKGDARTPLHLFRCRTTDLTPPSERIKTEPSARGRAGGEIEDRAACPFSAPRAGLSCPLPAIPWPRRGSPPSNRPSLTTLCIGVYSQSGPPIFPNTGL
jgi:hypothetical protein